MISIKKFLSSDDRETAEAFERMARLLLQAIGLHAVEGDRVDLDSFQAAVSSVQTSLDQDPSPKNILAATGSAVGALQNYNKRTSLFIRAKSVELQAIVGMLTQAMAQISNGSQNSISRLQELQKEIEHASMLGDVRALKTRLSDCLQSIRTEVTRQREESARSVADLGARMREARETKPFQALENCDPATGLPRRADAEAAIAATCEDGSHSYAGLFVVERLPAIRTRFGPAMADQVLVAFLQRLSQVMGPTDQVFRWDESSFLALLDRSASADQVRKELGKILSQRMEHIVDIESRSVVLPVASTWLVTPLGESGYPEILRTLQTFGASLHRP